MTFSQLEKSPRGAAAQADGLGRVENNLVWVPLCPHFNPLGHEGQPLQGVEALADQVFVNLHLTGFQLRHPPDLGGDGSAAQAREGCQAVRSDHQFEASALDGPHGHRVGQLALRN